MDFTGTVGINTLLSVPLGLQQCWDHRQALGSKTFMAIKVVNVIKSKA